MPELTYLAEDLLISIRNSGMIPDTGATGSDDNDLLRHCSEGILSYICPQMTKLREEYYYWREREAIDSNVSRYRIPPRALWNKLANVWLIQGAERIPQHFIPKEDLEDYGLAGNSGIPAGLVIDGNYIVIIPDGTPSASGSWEWCYFVRPGNLVKAAEYRRVIAPITTTSVTLDSAVPASWDNTKKFDIHSEFTGADYKDHTIPATTVSGTAITFSRNIDGTVFGTHAVAVGDYVLLEKTSAIPGVPPELFPQVARIAAMHWAESTGNKKKFDMHANVLKEYLNETLGAMEVRVEEKPLRIGSKRSFIDYQGRGYW